MWTATFEASDLRWDEPLLGIQPLVCFSFSWMHDLSFGFVKTHCSDRPNSPSSVKFSSGLINCNYSLFFHSFLGHCVYWLCTSVQNSAGNIPTQWWVFMICRNICNINICNIAATVNPYKKESFFLCSVIVGIQTCSWQLFSRLLLKDLSFQELTYKVAKWDL